MNETNYNETTNDAGAQEITGHDGGEMMFRGGMVPYSAECTQDDSNQYTFTLGGDTLVDSDGEPYQIRMMFRPSGEYKVDVVYDDDSIPLDQTEDPAEYMTDEDVEHAKRFIRGAVQDMGEDGESEGTMSLGGKEIPYESYREEVCPFRCVFDLGKNVLADKNGQPYHVHAECLFEEEDETWRVEIRRHTDGADASVRLEDMEDGDEYITPEELEDVKDLVRDMYYSA